MINSVLHLSDCLKMGKIKKLRMEANAKGTKFGCTVDYNATYYGATLEQACSKAASAMQKKSQSIGEKLLHQTAAQDLIAK